MEELQERNAEIKHIELEKMLINPCEECYICQNAEQIYGCTQKDDIAEIAEDILWADAIIFATPIFSWYCTAKMKAVLDRHYDMFHKAVKLDFREGTVLDLTFQEMISGSAMKKTLKIRKCL